MLGPQKINQYDEKADDLVRLANIQSPLAGYGTSFIGTILENLHCIGNVHVRYEDDVINPQQIYAMEFTLESLSAQTCDEFWSPKFVHRDPTLGQRNSFKIISMTNMAAFIDCPAER